MAFENIGVLVGRVWSRSGELIPGADVHLLHVSGSEELEIATLDGASRHPNTETDKHGMFVLGFRWSAADIGIASSPLSLLVYAWQDDVVVSGRMTTSTTIAKSKQPIKGYLIKNWAQQLSTGTFTDLSSASGIASFGKDLILAFNKIKMGPLHLPKANMMSTENWAIVGDDDITLWS